jgi:predicted phosphate transport protein (TIGR00153 family)
MRSFTGGVDQQYQCPLGRHHRGGVVYGARVPKFRLVPQNREFYALFDRAAANLVATSELLLELLQHYPDRATLVGEIKVREHVGDDVTHEIVQLVNKTFVTPIDREDIYNLAKTLDDICDFMDQVADELSLYGVEQVPPEAIEQAGVIHRAVAKLSEAIAGLDGLRDVSGHLVEIHTLEDEGDRIVRGAVARLFSNGMDPLIVIQWKDIHQDLEQAIDACEAAAHVLESVYLKNR